MAADCASQRCCCRNDSFTSQHLNARGPLPFSATMEVQGIYRTHWVNLTDTLLGGRIPHHIGTDFSFTSGAVRI